MCFKGFRDKSYVPLQGRGRDCTQVSEQTISDEGLIKNEILRPSSEILSETSMTNAQNDSEYVILNLFQDLKVGRNLLCHSERSEESQGQTHQAVIAGLRPQSQSRTQGNKSPLPPLLVCSRLTGLRARLSALTLRPQLASRFTKGGSFVAFTLAEGATHVDTFRDIRKPAFTLAEVLITLGVIGIVAAMTLPMLAENYQRIVIETRLKKFYTTFNQAILRAVEYHGPSESWNYSFSALYGDVQNYKPREIEFAFNYYLRDYLNVVQEQQVFYTNGAESKLYYLSDGSAFLFSPHTNVEVNFFPKNAAKCLRSSDSYGVCLFVFLYNPKRVNRNNKCDSSYEYHCNKGLEPYMYMWDGTIESLYTGRYGCKPSGSYCTALIQQNDWQFPKDYPRKIRY